MNSIQSLNRGLGILKLLAKNKKMTASAIALKLDIHQSSASRLLKSLLEAGFVRKPDFHSFALDYGVLLFGGIAMQGFPIVGISADICKTLKEKYDIEAAVAILRDERLVYLARTGNNNTASITLVDDSNFPIHRSSLGLALSHNEGHEQMREIIRASMISYGEVDYTLDHICNIATGSIEKHNFLYLKNFADNTLNAAKLFEFDNTPAALAIFTNSETSLTPSKANKILDEGIEEILRQFK